MPGQVGSATAPGQSRISVSTAQLDVSGEDQAFIGAGGTYTSESLRIIALSGLSVNVDRLALDPAIGTISVQVQIRIDSDTSEWRNLGVPCCCDPETLSDIVAGGGLASLAFVSWDHIAARQARFVVSGVVDTALGAITLMATAS